MVVTKAEFLDPKVIREMHGNPEILNAVIRMTGLSLAQLSERYHLGKTTVYQAIHKPTCPVGERVIISYLNTFEPYAGLTGHDLWPDRYGPDGERIIGYKPRVELPF